MIMFNINKINSDAVAYFGITDSINKAGYLLTDGTLLDFSCGQRDRVQDHREIRNILEDCDGYNDGLIRFVNLGNIRLQNNGFQLCKKLTTQQRRVIANNYNRLDECYIDIVDNKGNCIKSFSYELAPSWKILKDIDEYFEAA